MAPFVGANRYLTGNTIKRRYHEASSCAVGVSQFPLLSAHRSPICCRVAPSGVLARCRTPFASHPPEITDSICSTRRLALPVELRLPSDPDPDAAPEATQVTVQVMVADRENASSLGLPSGLGWP